MKIKDYVNSLKKLDQEADIYYLKENEETGDEACCHFTVCENQIQNKDKSIEKYYTIEKRE